MTEEIGWSGRSRSLFVSPLTLSLFFPVGDMDGNLLKSDLPSFLSYASFNRLLVSSGLSHDYMGRPWQWRCLVLPIPSARTQWPLQTTYTFPSLLLPRGPHTNQLPVLPTPPHPYFRFILRPVHPTLCSFWSNVPGSLRAFPWRLGLRPKRISQVYV